MGWDFCEAWRSTSDVKDALRREWLGAGPAGHTIKAEGVGLRVDSTDVWWVALEPVHAPGTGFVVCVLIEPEDGGTKRPGQHNAVGKPRMHGYKAMSEDMGPCFYDVPKAVLDAVPGPGGKYADAWRAEVRRLSS